MKLLVVGTGWASESIFPNLDVVRYDVTVLTPDPFITIKKYLPQVLGGRIESRASQFDSRTMMKRGGKDCMTLVLGSMIRLDDKNKSVTYLPNDSTSENVLSYDYLVLGVGATVPQTMEGVAEHCHFLRDTKGTLLARQKLYKNFETYEKAQTAENEYLTN
eukprot:Trichotokara_eunicae@DN8780_c0_g1_i1.p1